MKKIVVLKIAAIMLILAGGFYSCAEEKEKYQEQSFTEYSLAGTSCQWTKLNYDNKINIINSNAELENYITCTEGTFPEIDFTNKTLLLASGGTTNGVEKVQSTFIENSTGKYTLKVVVYLNDATVAEGWKISIFSTKISNEAIVELDVQQIRY
jgi:hypothetical protein